MFDAFVAAGGNFIDTANNYTNGTSEKHRRRAHRLRPGRLRRRHQVHAPARSQFADLNAGGNPARA